jgi:DNA mismatch repair protein MutS
MHELTPLMKQYFSIKERHKDAIVFFRLGDFYEMFGEDAEKASKILQIALTTRDKSRDNPIPMCGIPYFASETYIAKVIRAGLKVAICEQIGDPKETKGIVEREVVRVITPGTHAPENPKENTFIISIFPQGTRHGLAAADISTGQFIVYETEENIEDEISRFEPKEILMPDNLQDNIHYREVLSGYAISGLNQWFYEYTEAYKTLLRHFRVSSLEGYGCEDLSAAISAAGALISYLEETQKNVLGVKKISSLEQHSYLFLDASTQRNLELTHTIKDGSREETLLWVLDETLTPMGGRFLRSALLRPLTDVSQIIQRNESVEYLIEDYELLEELRNALRKVQDMERLSLRITAGAAHARDLVALKNSLSSIPRIKKSLLASRHHFLKSLGGMLSEFSLLKERIEKSIVDSPPVTIRDGGIIKNGFNSDVDELRNISSQSKDFISKMEVREKKRTGISSLKISFNKIFGYYIDVTKPNLDLVPDDYTRKQTLVGSERFITSELKEYENKVLGSEERLKQLEYELFQEILNAIRKEADQLLKTADALSVIDFLASLAVVAKRYKYSKPHMTEDTAIEISDGRHPVLERVLIDDRFIPNDTCIDTLENRLLIVTGPNMAGKSTYMRQVALIILMAQMGSFVPAAGARIGIVDRIFTRIGAADFLSKGQSTFMVEMIEAANIVNNATQRSLILLDEVGRGTSTFDGISIAWSMAEHILMQIKARTLFATHYNELTELALIFDGVRNYNVSVKEWGDEIIFLRKIEEGPADKSYGIQVARLAGIPDKIISRAKEVLNNLENEELNEMGKPKFASAKSKKQTEQLDIFTSLNEAVIQEIMSLDMERMKSEDLRLKLLELKRKLQL